MTKEEKEIIKTSFESMLYTNERIVNDSCSGMYGTCGDVKLQREIKKINNENNIIKKISIKIDQEQEIIPNKKETFVILKSLNDYNNYLDFIDCFEMSDDEHKKVDDVKQQIKSILQKIKGK